MLHVLVIDDEPAIGRAVSRLLRRHGVRVSVALDGSSALHLLSGSDDLPDIILLDVAMPVMSREEVLDALGRDARLAQIPVVVMSGADHDVTGHPNIRAVMPKPFETDELLSVLRPMMHV